MSIKQLCLHTPCALALLLASGCATPSPSSATQVLPGVTLELPRGALHDPRQTGIDSEVAYFSSDDYTVLVSRGVHQGLPSDPGWTVLHATTDSGLPISIARGPRPGEALPVGLALLERVERRWKLSGEAFAETTPPIVGIYVSCRTEAICTGIEAGALRTLRIDTSGSSTN